MASADKAGIRCILCDSTLRVDRDYVIRCGNGHAVKITPDPANDRRPDPSPDLPDTGGA